LMILSITMSDSDSNDETMQDEYNKRMNQSQESVKIRSNIGIANAIARMLCVGYIWRTSNELGV
jgi:hypothetical protein